MKQSIEVIWKTNEGHYDNLEFDSIHHAVKFYKNMNVKEKHLVAHVETIGEKGYVILASCE